MHSYQDIYIILIIGTLVIACLIFFVISFVVGYKRKQDAHLQEKKELHYQFQQEIMKAQLEIQEETFKVISQEVHDNIGQVLSLVKLNLGTVDFLHPDLASQKVSETRQLVGKAIQDLRNLAHSLHSDHIVDIGLPAAIEKIIQVIDKSGTCKTVLQVEGAVQKNDPQKELILFRIVQECINNILKHAQAGTITVHLLYTATACCITITDDGVGFNLPAGSENNSGLGIKSMYNRTHLIGARFAIASAPGKGTRVTIELVVSGK